MRAVAPLWLLSLVLALAFGSAVAAQDKVLIPEKIERTTAADDKGVLRWTEWKGERCPNCSGTGKHKCTVCARFIDEIDSCVACKRTEEREVTCGMCAGSGTLPDPLEKAPCPGCRGASFLQCTVCGGSGKSRVSGEKNWGKCVACRGDGGWKCGGCNGARLVEPAALKPSFKEAGVKDLQKAIAVTEQALKNVEGVQLVGGQDSRKSVKALVAAFEPAGSTHPALKRLAKPFEDYMGKIYAGRTWQGWEEKEAETMGMIRERVQYYLRHQKRMLELALQRAEANAKAAEEAKGK